MPTEHPVEFVWQLNLTDTGTRFDSREARELAHLLLHRATPLYTPEELDRIFACLSADAQVLRFATPYTDPGRRLSAAVDCLRTRVFNLWAVTRGGGEGQDQLRQQAARCLEGCRSVEDILRAMYADSKYDGWDQKIRAAPHGRILNLVGNYARFRLFATPPERFSVLEAFVHRAGAQDVLDDYDRTSLTMQRIASVARCQHPGAGAGQPRLAHYGHRTDFNYALAKYILFADLAAARPEFARRREMICIAALGRLTDASPLATLDMDLLDKILRLALAI